jgi:hypothetical protein
MSDNETIMDGHDKFTAEIRVLCEKFISGPDSVYEFDTVLSGKERSTCHDIAKELKISTETITFPDSTDKTIILRKKEKIKPPLNGYSIRVQDIEAFQKHSGISIPIPLPEYVDKYIDIFDEHFDAIKKWEYYQHDLKNKFDNNPQKLLEHIAIVRRTIIEDMKANDKFRAFMDSKVDNPKTPKTRALYNVYNRDKTFLSIDIRSANYTMIRKHIDGLFETDDWKDFVSKYTHSKFVINSKYFREYVFGELNATKKTKNLAKAFMDTIVDELFVEFQMKESCLVYREGDEIVYKFEDQSKLKEIRKFLNGKYPNMLHITSFVLRQLAPMKHFVKEQDDGTVDFKCIEKIYMCQAVKKYTNKPILDFDRKFIHNGIVATFDRSCYI